ncbi:hypothetical protein [Runella sp.]|uniref:hypothetical protein n=1 Tax=Runella sp. TaxID=1960881 RepID=UPI00301AA936
MIKASKILHRNEDRIKVDFPYNREISLLLKQIPDAQWSKSHGAWHIPYTKTAFEELKSLFPDIEIVSLKETPAAQAPPPVYRSLSNTKPLLKALRTQPEFPCQPKASWSWCG